jgi:acetylornithine deacetylase
MTGTCKLLRELIALPSVNPKLLPANHPHAGEQRMTDFLTALAAQNGLEIELQPVFPGRANLFARLRPSGQTRRRILLAPHLDTVPVAQESQFKPVIKNGRLYGRGACDTKGSVAAMFAAVCEIAKKGRRPAETEIIFVGLADEEVGQGGSRALAASGFKADLAIVGEPTRLELVTAHKGSIYLEMKTTGKAAHGSCPELGRNAILEMARVVEWLETDYARHLGKHRHPLLGPATVNVGTIRGGGQTNIVPAHCSITIDRRTIPGETENSVCREVKTFLRQKGLAAELDCVREAPCHPLETDARLPLVRQLLECVGQKHPAGVKYFCDASVLAQGGIPSVVFGPGDIAQAHTDDEWISLSSLERAKDMLVKFVLTLP